MPMSLQPAPPATEAKVPLSRDRILHAAVAMADEGGLESLSMRRLAQGLGVEAMSLYHHVGNKQDLMGGMLNAVYEEVEPPSSEGDWRAAMRRSAISFHHVLLRHPWACSLLGSTIGASPTRLRHMDTVLGRLRGAGFSADMTHHAYHALDSHIVGFTLWLLPYMTIARQQPDYAERFLGELSVDDLPHLVEHIGVHMAPDAPGGVDEFEFGLDLILDGLERLRDTGSQLMA
jgi:AcrR family transcriptional regulator